MHRLFGRIYFIEENSLLKGSHSVLHNRTLMMVLVGLGLLFGLVSCKPLPKQELILVEDGVAKMPIIVFENAPPFTRQAAEELAEYIGKISGAKPEVIEGLPDPVPEQAIWVGFQPKLKEIFPNLDFDFKHPEEILISSDGKNLVIAGRDRWDPNHMTMKDRRGKDIVGIQREYGTANAVYTFMQDQLGVRWLWPGELGTDIIQQSRIALEPFTTRYHPQIRDRDSIFMIYTLRMGNKGAEWARHQRLQLDSMFVQYGHPFADWWDRFHETHPEYFALQPDGKRGTPGGRTAKISEGNPAVWEQWMRDVETQMLEYPDRFIFGANQNDGWTYGYCVSEESRALDHPDAKTYTYTFGTGRVATYLSNTDRQINFANILAEKLKERFPDRDDLMVSAMAYGTSRPPPVAAKPADNVIVAGVWSFHNQPREEDKNFFVEWAKIAPSLAWRPNLTSNAGWKAGFPNSAPRRVIEDLRFVADHGVVAIAMDWIFESWAGQGPHYYMLAQMAWNPRADGEAILADYYQRAFGPAAKTMTGYWDLINQAAERIGYEGEAERDVWNREFFDDAYARLDRAAKEVESSDEKYGQRITFVRSALDFLRLITFDMQPYMDRLAETGGEDAEARAAAQAKWEEVWKEVKEIAVQHPFSISGSYSNPGSRHFQKYSPDAFKGTPQPSRKSQADEEAPPQAK